MRHIFDLLLGFHFLHPYDALDCVCCRWIVPARVDTLSAAIRTLVHLTEKIPKETKVSDRMALHSQMLRLKADIVRSPSLLRILLGRLRDPIRLGPECVAM